MKIEIVRLYETPETNSKQTEGLLYVIDDNKIIFECKTLELPWKDNQFRVSCIPAGIYTAKKRLTKYSHFKYEHFHILDVKNRDNILIHAGNYAYKKKLIKIVKNKMINKTKTKTKILNDAGITKDHYKYTVEETKTEYKIYETVGDTLGCILVGEEFIDINNDGVRDVTSSRTTLRKILSLVKTDEIELEIKCRG